MFFPEKIDQSVEMPLHRLSMGAVGSGSWVPGMTDSDDDESDLEEDSKLANRACVTQSGRAVRAFVRLDL